MSSAVRKNLVDLNSALSAHQDIFRSIVIMCEQKGLITPGVSKELRDPLTGKSTQDRASQLVSNLQTAIGLQPECLDTLLCILKDEGGVSGSIVAQKIAEECKLFFHNFTFSSKLLQMGYKSCLNIIHQLVVL